MNRLPTLLALVSLLLAASATMLAQTPKGAHIGTWKLNVAKSKFNPGPGYRSETRTYEPTADGYKFQGECANPDGSTPKYGFTVKYENKDYPVAGRDPGGADTIAVKLVDANNPQGKSSATREAEARAPIDEFFRAFNARDNEAIKKTLNFPHVRINEMGQVTVARDASEGEVNFEELFSAVS